MLASHRRCGLLRPTVCLCIFCLIFGVYEIHRHLFYLLDSKSTTALSTESTLLHFDRPFSDNSLLNLEVQKLFPRGWFSGNSGQLHKKFRHDYLSLCGLDGRNQLFCAADHLLTTEKKATGWLVHSIVRIDQGDLAYHQMISFLSIFWKLRPKYLILWDTSASSNWNGENWKHFLFNVSRFSQQIIRFAVPNEKTSTPVILHQLKLELLWTFGGIYLDSFVVVTKSFHNFTQSITEHEHTCRVIMGRDGPQSASGNVLIVSKEKCPFIAFWYKFLTTSDNSLTSSIIVHTLPHLMAQYWKEHIHFNEMLSQPNEKQVDWLYSREFQRRWNWKERNACVTLWPDLRLQEINGNSVFLVQNMAADVIRYVLRGF